MIPNAVQEKMSGWLRSRILDQGELEVRGRQYWYVVVRRNVDGAPRWFAGLDEPSGVFFISDEVPSRYREYMLFHEMHELGELRGVRGRCRLALEAELERVAPADLREYLDFRCLVLRALYGYMTAGSGYGHYQPDQISEVSAAIEYLKQRRRNR